MVFWFILVILLLVIAGALVLLVLPILFNDHNVKHDARDTIEGVVIASCLFCFLGGMVFHVLITEDKPKAIDVYRGNAEIQVDYHIRNNDTINMDTTIVFKNR